LIIEIYLYLDTCGEVHVCTYVSLYVFVCIFGEGKEHNIVVCTHNNNNSLCHNPR